MPQLKYKFKDVSYARSRPLGLKQILLFIVVFALGFFAGRHTSDFNLSGSQPNTSTPANSPINSAANQRLEITVDEPVEQRNFQKRPTSQTEYPIKNKSRVVLQKKKELMDEGDAGLKNEPLEIPPAFTTEQDQPDDTPDKSENTAAGELITPLQKKPLN